MPGSLKGILVALANTFIVAVCMAAWLDADHIGEATVIITMVGAIPAVLIGAFLGYFAEVKQSTNRRVMLVWMISVACAAVAFLGTIFDLPELILVSCIPTAAACSVLERWTRARADEAFPYARVA